MAYITNQAYYSDPNNSGEYQYVSLSDIVNNFMLMYVGDDKLIGVTKRYNVLFHAKRAIQELNYDAARNVKVLELNVGEDLKLVLPPDYVNYARISMEVEGTLFTLSENMSVNYAQAYLKDSSDQVLYDQNGSVITGTSELDIKRIEGYPQTLFTGEGWANGKWGWNVDDYWYFNYSFGGYFGLNSEVANVNPTFRIDKASGVINFSSGMSNRLVVIEYISDGLENGDDDAVKVNKLAEDFIYSYIKWAILNNKVGVQEYIVRRAREEKSAMLRNAKIRLSNIKPNRILMVLRNQGNWIK
jgi:hypothetical protein